MLNFNIQKHKVKGMSILIFYLFEDRWWTGRTVNTIGLDIATLKDTKDALTHAHNNNIKDKMAVTVTGRRRRRKRPSRRRKSQQQSSRSKASSAMPPISILILALVCSLCREGWASMPPNPEPRQHTQPDGTIIELITKGSPEDFNLREEDVSGYTVVNGYRGSSKHERGGGIARARTKEAPAQELVYATTDSDSDSDGELIPSHCVVGRCDPTKFGLSPHLERAEHIRTSLRHRFGFDDDDDATTNQQPPPLHRGLSRQRDRGPVLMKNLVVLLRFADHVDRPLPSPSDYNIMFNEPNCQSHPCPTGSVRDYFEYISYGQLVVQSEAWGWVTVPQTERYYADEYYGMTGLFAREAIKYALSEVELMLLREGRDMSEFDVDGDGYIDSITIIHSGYDGSNGRADCQNPEAVGEHRIWNHKWQIPGDWATTQSRRETRIRPYHANAGMWGHCGEEICRIASIAHEHCHFLGLDDLYDGHGGNGIGNWDIMGNAWGWDGSQRYPPMMSSFHKYRLGWIDPIEIVEDGTYTLPESHSEPVAYIIRKNYPAGEYLMIENRRPHGTFEKHIPEGLLIYHVDEKSFALNKEGHPEMEGWPENGHHYRYSVLGADGNYNLEKGNNLGDGTDVYHRNNVADAITPDGVASNGILTSAYPRTWSYQNQNDIRPTGHYIYDISEPGPTMSFSFKTCLDCNVEETLSALANPRQDGSPLDEPEPVVDAVEPPQDRLPTTVVTVVDNDIDAQATETVMGEEDSFDRERSYDEEYAKDGPTTDSVTGGERIEENKMVTPADDPADDLVLSEEMIIFELPNSRVPGSAREGNLDNWPKSPANHAKSAWRWCLGLALLGIALSHATIL